MALQLAISFRSPWPTFRTTSPDSCRKCRNVGVNRVNKVQVRICCMRRFKPAFPGEVLRWPHPTSRDESKSNVRVQSSVSDECNSSSTSKPAWSQNAAGKPDKVERLRQMLQGREIIQGPCCYDALGARLVEMAGFPLVVMSGFAVSASRLGMPDTGLLSYGETVDQAQLIASAVQIPLIADADTGYGSVLNVKRTVRGFQQAGVAALIIEDQLWPKACGHTTNRQVVSREEAVTRFRAAVDARDELQGDILVVARSDARQAVSLEEAIWRAKAFADAGADMVFVDALSSREDMAALCKALPDTPKMVNMLEGGGKTPVLPPAELESLGFKLALYPLSLLGVAIRAQQDALVALRSGRLPPPYALPTFEEIKSIVGFDAYYAEEKRYSIAPSTSGGTSNVEPQAAGNPSDSSSSQNGIPSDGVGPYNPQVGVASRRGGEGSGASQASGPSDSSGEDTSAVCAGDFECDDEAPPGTSSNKNWADQSANPGSNSSPSGAGPAGRKSDAVVPAGPNGVVPPGAVPRRDVVKVFPDSGTREGSARQRFREVVEAEVLEAGSSTASSTSEDYRASSSSKARNDGYSSLGGIWSRVVRVKVSDRLGNNKLDFRVPAGFLDGLAGTIPAVAGINLKALFDERLKGRFTGDAQPVLDITDRTGTGDRVQIFIE